MCELHDGPFGSDLLADDYVDGGIPLLRMQNITSKGSPNLLDVETVSKPAAKRLAKHHAHPGDLVVTKIGFLGHATILPNDYPLYVFRRELTKCVPISGGPEVSHALATFFNGRFGRSQFYRYSSGTTRDRVLLTSQRFVLVPPLSNELQRVCATALGESQKQQKRAESELRDAEARLISVLGFDCWQPPQPLSFTFRSAEVFNAARLDADYFSPRVTDLLARLSEGGQTVNDVAPPRAEKFAPIGSGDFDYIEISDVGNDGTTSSTRLPLSDAPSRAQWLVRANDIITSTVRPVRRLSALIMPGQDGFVCSSGFVVLNPKTVAPEVLLTYLRLPLVCELMDLHTSASLYPAISETDLLKLPFPRIDEVACTDIVAAVKNAHTARKSADALLAKAQRAVEIAIEESEARALKFLKEPLN